MNNIKNRDLFLVFLVSVLETAALKISKKSGRMRPMKTSSHRGSSKFVQKSRMNVSNEKILTQRKFKICAGLIS
jgi:hypothetical protein